MERFGNNVSIRINLIKWQQFKVMTDPVRPCIINNYLQNTESSITKCGDPPPLR